MNVKGVSWVGDMRQRFEALCVEVDETIYEDTVNYVGNQMRTVKESVKNFYTEVMQDLRGSSPLCSSSSREKYTPESMARKDDAVIREKPKIDNNNNNYESFDAEEIPEDYYGFAISDNSQSESAYLVPNRSTVVENYLKSRQEEDRELNPVSDSFRKDGVEESVYGKPRSERDELLCGCEDIGSNKFSDVKVIDPNENEAEISTDLDDTISSSKPVLDTTIVDNVGNAMEVPDKFYVSKPGVDKQARLKLDESCVLVEKDDHFPKSTPEDEQNSYKKKIKEAFSSSRWTISKKNHVHRAGMYEEEQSGKSLSYTRHRDIQNSLTSEPFESEWELL